MKVEILDDWKSFIHIVLGMSSPWMPFILPIYIIYQLVTALAKNEKREHLLGDILEYLAGAGVSSIAYGMYTSLVG